MNRKRLEALLLTFMLMLGLAAVPQTGLAADENLAPSAAAITSSDFNSGFGKEKLNDKITSGANNMRWTTDWSVAANAIGQWCGVEFDAPTKIDKIVFYEYDSRITEYKVEYMDASGAWNTVQKDGAALANQTKEAKETVNSAHSVANTVTFDAVEAKAVRIYIVNVGAKAGASIWEFEVYNTSVITADTNLALRGTGVADTTKSTTDSRFLAANLNDGSTSGNSRWSSNWNLSMADVVGVWVGIQFSEAIAFDKITIKEFQGRVTKFIIEVSDDGENWTAVKQSGQEMSVQEKEYQKTCTNSLRSYDISFDRVKVAYVRYRIVEVGEAAPSIWEIEVYDSLAGAPFEEAEDEAAFQADVDSVTEASLLGNNPNAQNITEDLTLTASPMPNGTRLVWSVVSGGEWIDNKGKVTRPAADSADQTVQLKAAFTSPGGTYTDEKTFTFTVLKQDAGLIEEQFQQDIGSVTEAYLLGANPDAEHVQWSLNLPVSPLQGGTTVAWRVTSGTAIAENGKVTRPETEAQQVTLQAAFTKAGAAEASETRDFTFTVLPDEKAVWKLVENVKVEDPRGASTYAITQITDGISSSGAKNGGVQFGQLTNNEVPSTNRPDMRLNFADKIKPGKKYYVEMTLQADMKKGEARVLVLNGTGGEGALFIFRSSNTLGLAANNGSGRNWIDKEVTINHTHGKEETIGIYYDAGTGAFQHVSGGKLASQKTYKPSYGSGIGGVQVSYQGKEGDKDAYIVTKGMKVYEYDADYAVQIETEFGALSAADLTQQIPEMITGDLTLPSALPCGVPIHWESSMPDVIGTDGTVTRPEDAEKTVRLTAKIDETGLSLSKTFDFTVLWTGDARIGFTEDVALVTYETLTAQEPDKLTESLTMPFSPLPNGTTVTWTSDDTTVLSAEGVVTRPAGRNHPVTLTAKFQNGELSAEKTFQFTVLAEGDLLENMAADARPSANVAALEGSIVAVTDGDYETAWTVAAKNPAVTLDLGSAKLLTHAVIYAEGNIQNAVLEVSNDNINYTKAAQWNALAYGQEIQFPLTDARYIRLNMTQQDETAVKIYEIELYSMPSDEERVQADVKAFTYTNPKVVTADIILPTATKYGSTLEWSSDNAAALDAQGHVTRQSGDQNVTLTATFRSGDKSETVTVYHTVKGTKPAAGQSPGGGGGGGGGSVSGGSGGAGMQVPVIQPENTVRPQPQPQEARFYDVEMQRWSYSYIERLAQQGIVNGSGGAFDPEGHLTREQLVKLLVTALKLDIGTQNTTFADVAAGEWYSPYIAAAAQAGIVSGISETEFGVGEYVSREDMATMICRALEKCGVQFAAGGTDTTFADSAQISAYAQEAVAWLTALGILNGENGNFLPADTATREQGAKVICMVLDKINS